MTKREALDVAKKCLVPLEYDYQIKSSLIEECKEIIVLALREAYTLGYRRAKADINDKSVNQL